MREFEALSKANKFITTSLPLVEILKSRYARTPCYNLGLASTYQSFASKRAQHTPFQIGFLGSLYEGQGVHWLAENWKIIRKLSGDKHSLHVYAMTRKGDTPLNGSPENGVFVKAAVPPSQVPKICEGLDALVIPALSKGRLPFVAFTKAYDYPGLGLPILCSDLPTIREVLEEERHALFFQPGDANGLADCIARLAGNQGLADSMASNLRQRASEFSWDSRARRWWEAVLQ
jgi:glycosyltransferase involved in cell wall biosynthesis